LNQTHTIIEVRRTLVGESNDAARSIAVRYSRRMKWILGLLPLVALFLGSCGTPPVPKPEGYPRIALPEKVYRLVDTTLPYRVQLPVYAKLQLLEDGIGQDVLFPDLKGTLHLTYYYRPGALDTLVDDAHRMAYKHTIKADAIEELSIDVPEHRVYAVLFKIYGNAASNVQFYATDSASHYLRGALYFDCEPNADSLAPAVNFLTADIERLIQTLEWK